MGKRDYTRLRNIVIRMTEITYTTNTTYKRYWIGLLNVSDLNRFRANPDSRKFHEVACDALRVRIRLVLFVIYLSIRNTFVHLHFNCQNGYVFWIPSASQCTCCYGNEYNNFITRRSKKVTLRPLFRRYFVLLEMYVSIKSEIKYYEIFLSRERSTL